MILHHCKLLSGGQFAPSECIPNIGNRGVLVFCGGHNKLPHTWWRETTDMVSIKSILCVSYKDTCYGIEGPSDNQG